MLPPCYHLSMKVLDCVQAIRSSRRARLSVLLLAAIGCPESGDDSSTSPGATGAATDATNTTHALKDTTSTTTGASTGTTSTSTTGAGEHPERSYTVGMVTSACDDLSSAAVLPLGKYTHVTAYTDLPFPFPLFGDAATRFVIAEHGHVYLGGPDLFVSVAGEPQQPPNEAIPNGWVAPFWDPHLTYVPGVRGDVRVMAIGTGDDERLVIGYNDFTLAFPSKDIPDPDIHLSFQVALLRQSEAIEFRYCELKPGPNATKKLLKRVHGAGAGIALESADGTRGIVYSFKTPAITEGMAIRFTPAP